MWLESISTRRWIILGVFAAAFGGARCCVAAEDGQAVEAASSFAAQVAPFLESHCNDCHGLEEPEGGLALARYRDSANVQSDFEVWEKVLRMLTRRQMPPKEQSQPSEQERREVVRAIEAELARFDCGSQKHPGRVTIRRLNRAEYNNTVRDLLDIDFKPADDFPSDDVGEGFDNIGDVLTISPILLEKYLAAAEQVVDKAFQSEATRKQLLAVQPDDDVSRRDAARRNLESFALRAFRRPASSSEIERLGRLMRDAREAGAEDEESYKTAFMAILASPHFLFRVERDPDSDDKDGIRDLNDYELASRLSYFLWSTMPDEQLFELAKDEKLRRPEVLQEQVRRMLADPKAAALTDNFAGQWLQLRSLVDITPDPERFADFDEPLRAAMLRETELFFESVVREDRSVLDFLNADFTHVNQRLAKHYGMSGVKGDEFRRVQLSSKRRGVLTHASILMLTSNPTRTSPVKRGKWILDNILGEPPPPPPAGVEELDEEAEALGSLRERLQQHRSNESCAVCHLQMDSLGFGLENFDVIGAWRERDGKFEIDPSGELPGGRSFENASELMGVLAEDKKDEFCRCLAEKLLTYALGRGLESYDRCAVDEILKQLSSNDYRFSSLVSAVVLSDPFRMREALGAD